MTSRRIRTSMCAMVAAFSGADSIGEPPQMSDLLFAPGESQVARSVETQEWCAIAPGGDGFLVVWQDKRPVLSGQVNTAYEPLGGNGWDIYAARLDAAGNLLDPTPIIIDSRGRNQTRPQVAWNGENWLIVYMSERPDWYFFTDIVGVRVAPDGGVLDADPIPIRPETIERNDSGYDPHVSSDGENWLVVWESLKWVGDLPYPNVEGRRVGPDGDLIEPQPTELHRHNISAFGPRDPQVVWASDEYLLVWEEAAMNEIRALRLNANMSPIGAPFLVSGLGNRPRVATDGDLFVVVTGFLNAHRVTHDGVVLDPGGISFQGNYGYQMGGPDIAWTGDVFDIAFSGINQGNSYDILFTQVDADGAIDPATVIHGTVDDEWRSAIASRGDGRAQVAWTQTNYGEQRFEDIRGLQVDSNGTPGASRNFSVGLSRQTVARVLTQGGRHTALYYCQHSGSSRLVVQRFDSNGMAIDAQPRLIALFGELQPPSADITFNGTHYFVTWATGGAIVGRRFTADLNPVDLNPILLVADPPIQLAVGSIGNAFLVAYTRQISGDQRALRMIRLNASNLALLQGPVTIVGNYVLNPVISTLGSRAFMMWERQSSHDTRYSSIEGAFVHEGGTVETTFVVSGVGDSNRPDIAVGEDRCLIVWDEAISTEGGRVEGRIMHFNGSLLTGEIPICDATYVQAFPAAAWDGQQFLAAWVDFRTNLPIEQMRGDIWAARIDVNGALIDPDGFQVTATELPEDLPFAVGADGLFMLGFAMLHGVAAPEVQRFTYRMIGDLGSDIATISSIQMITGSILSGGIPELLQSDDASLRLRSGFGRTFVDLHHMETIIHANTASPSPATLDLTIESRLDQPSGTARIRLRNWNTTQFVEVGQHALNQTDQSRTINGIPAANYVNAGAIDLSIKHVVFAPIFAFTFESYFDHVEIVVR